MAFVRHDHACLLMSYVNNIPYSCVSILSYLVFVYLTYVRQYQWSIQCVHDMLCIWSGLAVVARCKRHALYSTWSRGRGLVVFRWCNNVYLYVRSPYMLCQYCHSSCCTLIWRTCVNINDQCKHVHDMLYIWRGLVVVATCARHALYLVWSRVILSLPMSQYSVDNGPRF